MGHGLRVKRGSTTVDLYYNSGKTYDQRADLVKYRPTAPRVSESEYLDLVRQGLDLADLAWLDVQETVEFDVTDTHIADVRTYVQGLEKLLPSAEEYRNRKVGQPCYLEFDPAESGTWWRSEILAASVQWEETILEAPWAMAVCRVTLTLRRRFYWEASTRVQLTLTNGSGSGTSIVIYNHDDAGVGHDCWFTYPADTANLVLPSPADLVVLNSTPDADGDATIWVGQFVLFSGASYPALVIEGEAMTGASSQADANSSGGAFGRVTWAGDSQSRALYSTLTADQQRNEKMRRFLALARTPSDMSGITVQCKLAYPTGASSAIIQEGETVTLSSDLLQSFGILTIPPWLWGAESAIALDSIQFEVWAQKTGGGTLDVDYIYLLPLDGYRIIETIGAAIEYQQDVEDDGAGPHTWAIRGSAISGDVVGSGGPLYIWPQGGKIFLLFLSEAGDADITRTHGASLYIHPRRLTL